MKYRLDHFEFVPPPFLKDGHVMTLAPTFLPRRFPLARQTSRQRLFRVAEGVRLLAHCHWQPEPAGCATLIILHGLEGSSESHYVLGAAEKALSSGMNAVRLNLRNCGGSMHLTSTLYNAGLSSDVLSVLEELKRQDGLSDIFIAGYSLGGGIVLKAAGDLAQRGPSLLSGVCAVSPPIDLSLSVGAIGSPPNRIYEKWFLRTLKEKIRDKARSYPELYDLTPLESIRTLREFDEVYTAPAGGYGTAENYYRMASAARVLDKISVPALIIASQDDPIVPFAAFENQALGNGTIKFIATRHGGHAGFVHRHAEYLPVFDRFWAENRIVKFCLEVMSKGSTIPGG